MLHGIVLGAAAGGGLPQWNCACANCAAARAGQTPASTQVSIALSANARDWILINASPDLRQQIAATPQLHPRPGMVRNSPIAGVVVINAEVDAVAGLLSMREGAPFTLYAHRQVLNVLQSNSIFNVLDAAKVIRTSIAPGLSFEPQVESRSIGLRVTPFDTPGKPAWYLEDVAAASDGDTLGLRIEDLATGRSVCIVTACARVTAELKAQLQDCDILLFDGTLWRDDELIAARLGHKTGQRMGHISMDGENGAIASLADVKAKRKVFVHINNSNPVWHVSHERETVERAGWEIGFDGMEFVL